MMSYENMETRNETHSEEYAWLQAANQDDPAREKKRQLRQKQRTEREEMNEQFRNLVNHNR